MKKKILMLLCAICLIIPAAFILTACSTAEDINVKIPTEDINIQTPTDFTIKMEGEEKTQHRITIINDSERGTIYPKLNNDTSSVLVDEGDSYTVTIKAEDGFMLESLLINGNKVESVDVYTLSDISTDYTISAVFSEIIDSRHFIKEMNLVGMIFDLSPNSPHQEVESLSCSIRLYSFHDGGSSSSIKNNGYVYCGKNQESKFTNSLNFSNWNIAFNDSINYELALEIDAVNTLSYSFIPNKMELEYVADDIYMIKLDNQSTNAYHFENITLYFNVIFD